MKKTTCFILSVLMVFGMADFVHTQPLDLGIEFQAYPTGLIPGFRIERCFGNKNAVHLRVGYNWIRHRDLGVHEDERGDGFGMTVGYKRYFKENFQGIFLGFKNDLWFNTLRWKDGVDSPTIITGETKITVVQPSAELGYFFNYGKNGFFAPSIAFGYEVNVKTNGAPVGEGAILLLGFTVGKRIFNSNE